MLKKLFGMHLGTADYGHLVVDHSAMLLRHFDHSTNTQVKDLSPRTHDASRPGQSCKYCKHFVNSTLACYLSP